MISFSLCMWQRYDCQENRVCFVCCIYTFLYNIWSNHFKTTQAYCTIHLIVLLYMRWNIKGLSLLLVLNFFILCEMFFFDPSLKAGSTTKTLIHSSFVSKPLSVDIFHSLHSLWVEMLGDERTLTALLRLWGKTN